MSAIFNRCLNLHPTMHHLNPYYQYSAELLKTALAAHQTASSPTSPTAAFSLDNLLSVPRPLMPRAALPAGYFPYIPATAAAAFNLPSQQDIIAGEYQCWILCYMYCCRYRKLG